LIPFTSFLTGRAAARERVFRKLRDWSFSHQSTVYLETNGRIESSDGFTETTMYYSCVCEKEYGITSFA